MSMFRLTGSIVFSLGLLGTFGACSQGSESSADTPSKAADAATQIAKKNKAQGPSLLLSQAQFIYETTPDGKKIPKPGPAKLTILSFNGDSFEASVLEDEESRVFHKTLCINKPDEPAKMLTLGATSAHLKTWEQQENGWVGRSHWKPTFGGKWNRLRDVEIGDVNQDGKDELVLATHDQGVIAIASPEGDSWKIQEIDREANTFIHEIEIGDVNADGRLEFFATPSKPNRANQSQGGGVTGYFFENGKYKKEVVAAFPKRHAKEIYVGDIDGDGVDELYASVEAQTRKTVSGPVVVKPLEIRRYDRQKNGKWKQSKVATLDGGIQARVILGGDLMNRGKKQLVVTTMKGGIFALEPGPKKWTKHLIDANSSGFEHAAGLFDINGNGKLDLVVAADDQNVVTRYQYENGSFKGQIIAPLESRDLTWSIEICHQTRL